MNTATFKGFKNWVEIFRSGTHTDSTGKVKTWTNDDLDQIVATHSAKDGAALVIGHPKANSPRYGEVSELKRDGDSLFAKFANVHDAVELAAQQRSYPKRSAKIASTPKGLKLVHVGLLGAAPPAIEGLADVYAAEDEGETFEFSWAEGSAISGLARIARGLRDWMIDKFDLETADRVIPSYEIENAERLASQIQSDDDSRSTFTAHTEDQDMPFSQEQLDAAVAAERKKTEAAEARANAFAAKQKEGEFAARLATNTAFVSTLISDDAGKVRLTPAEAAGWAEALTFAQAIDGDSTEFTFAAPDQSEQKQNLYEFMKAKLSALAPRLQLGGEKAGGDTAPQGDGGYTFAAPSDSIVDPTGRELHSRAKAYQAQNPNVGWLDAVRAVS